MIIKFDTKDYGSVLAGLLVALLMVLIAREYSISSKVDDINDTNVTSKDMNNSDSPIAYIYREFCADGTLYWELTNVATHSVHVGLRLQNKSNTVQVLDCE